MITVKVNGEDSSIKPSGLPKIADVVELIKSSIDPDHMITGILLNGEELKDNEWTASTTEFGTAIIEVQTGTPESFVSDRLSKASAIVRACFMQFRDARKSYQSGNMQEANQKLLEAVNMLQAFFQWLSSIIDLVPESEKQSYNITDQVTEISTVCTQITQHQLYQSWWALGESIEKELEPRLDKLEDFCRGWAEQV